MILRSFTAPLAFVAMTSGCFDFETAIDMKLATMTQTAVIERQAYDNGMADALCDPDASKTIGTEIVTCVSATAFDRDSLLQNLMPDSGDPPEEAVGFRLAADGNFVLIANPAAFGASAPPEGVDEDMIGVALSGHSIVIALEGVTIIESDGEISPDGQSTKLVFPLLDIALPERAKNLKPLRAVFTYP